MIEIGKSYYFIVHAYHHVLGTVTAITGKRSATLANVIRVQSSQKDWTAFFDKGIGKDDTTYTVWPDGTGVEDWMIAAPWNHPIPKR